MQTTSASTVDEVASPRINDRYEYAVHGVNETYDVVVTRLAPWTIQDSVGRTIHVAPLRITRVDDGSADVWMQDLETGRPIGAMSIRRQTSPSGSVLDNNERVEWAHTIAYSADAVAAHCLNARSPAKPAGPCHLTFAQFWGHTNHGTSSWSPRAEAPDELVVDGVQWTLKSFQGGSKEYPRWRSEGVARQLDLSDGLPWGIADENVDHLFPLSSAFRRAAANATLGQGQDYATWRQAQRVTFPVSGTLDLSPRGARAEAAWRLSVQGDDSFLVLTGKNSFLLFEQYHLGLSLPDDTIEEKAGTWAESGDPPINPVAWPRLDESITKVWNPSFGTRPPPITSWGFAAACPDDCPIRGPLVTMGFSSEESWTTTANPVETPYTEARLMMRPSGEVVQFEFTSTKRSEPELAVFHEAPGPRQPLVAWANFPAPVEPVPVAPELLAVTGLLTVALFGIRGWWRHAVAFFGFAMGKTSRPESETRQRIRRLIEAEPGIHFREVVRRMGISNGTAVYHLRTLVRRRLVRAEERGGYRCFFPAGPIAKEIDAIRALKPAGAQRIADALREGPMEVVRLCAITGLRHTTIAYHVDKMVDAGLIDVQRTHRPRVFALTQLGRRLAE